MSGLKIVTGSLLTVIYVHWQLLHRNDVFFTKMK